MQFVSCGAPACIQERGEHRKAKAASDRRSVVALFLLAFSWSPLTLIGVEFGLFAAVTLRNHPAGEFPLKLLFDVGVLRVRGEIVPFVRILLHVEEFFRRTVLVAAVTP